MLTFKQMEALHWIVQLGSFELAASKLNASQSAISKRIQELESTFDFPVFDRSNRSARLTEKGIELFEYAKELLERRDEIVERVSAKKVLVRRIRIGVTELTALTWLPRLITAIKQTFPRVTVEAEVDLSSTLRDRLAADTIDMIIVPQALASERFTSTRIGSVDNAWMCAPSLHSDKTTLPIADIAQLPLILQGNLSGTGLTYDHFLSENGVNTARILVANNLVAQVGLTVSGMGVSYLPIPCLNYMVSAGALRIIKTRPALPTVRYVALHRHTVDRSFSLSHQIAQLAQACCDFTSNLLAPNAHTTSSSGLVEA